ncbi:MAG: hypothetical protein ABR564_01070 [Candidatus Dormibacteria bacterium]
MDAHALEGLIPFQPFSLEPEEERALIFRGIFANCDAHTSGFGIERQELHYKVLGVERTQWLRLRQPLSFFGAGPSTPQCPLLEWRGGLLNPRSVRHALLAEDTLAFTHADLSYQLTLSSYKYVSPSTCRSHGQPEMAQGAPVGITIVAKGPEHPEPPMALRLIMSDPTGTHSSPLFFDTTPTRFEKICAPASPLQVEDLRPGGVFMLAGTAQPLAVSPTAAMVHVAVEEGTNYREVGTLRLALPLGREPVPPAE